MPKSKTQAQALSRLFGDSKADAVDPSSRQDRPSTDRVRDGKPGEDKKLTNERAQLVQGGQEGGGDENAASAPLRARAATEQEQAVAGEQEGGGDENAASVGSDVASSMTAAKDAQQTGTDTGYLGNGRYQRRAGIFERIAPYVRPDQAEALRVRIALRNDPRGHDISSIIQSLLDEAGYRSDSAAQD